MVSFGSPDPNLPFPTIEKNVQGGLDGPGAAVWWVGGGERGREEEEARLSRRSWSRSRRDSFKKIIKNRGKILETLCGPENPREAPSSLEERFRVIVRSVSPPQGLWIAVGKLEECSAAAHKGSS